MMTHEGRSARGRASSTVPRLGCARDSRRLARPTRGERPPRSLYSRLTAPGSTARVAETEPLDLKRALTVTPVIDGKVLPVERVRQAPAAERRPAVPSRQ